MFVRIVIKNVVQLIYNKIKSEYGIYIILSQRAI